MIEPWGKRSTTGKSSSGAQQVSLGPLRIQEYQPVGP